MYTKVVTSAPFIFIVSDFSYFYNQFETVVSSVVVDPNKLYLDPDLEFWPKLDLDPGIVINFEGQMVKIVLEENIFSL